jgi:hypothetical protein
MDFTSWVLLDHRGEVSHGPQLVKIAVPYRLISERWHLNRSATHRFTYADWEIHCEIAPSPGNQGMGAHT